MHSISAARSAAAPVADSLRSSPIVGHDRRAIDADKIERELGWALRKASTAGWPKR